VEVQKLRSPNVKYLPRNSKNRLAWQTTDNKPGEVVFKIQSTRGNLQEIHAAARYQLRVPPPENHDYRLEVSTDNGQSWKLITQATIPSDNEYSSGWMSGTAKLSQAKNQEALIRVRFYQDGYPTGLIDVRLYGVRETTRSTESSLTYGWKENGQTKSHREQIPAGVQQKTFQIPTGSHITDDYIRIAVP
jgi:hypothetical protein